MYWKIGVILTVIILYVIIYFYTKSEFTKVVEQANEFFQATNNMVILEQVLERTE